MAICPRGVALVLLALLAVSCVGATMIKHVPTSKRALGRDAVHVLFGKGGDQKRSLLSGSNAGINYETLRVVAHPLRKDMSQKKVQQMHAGLELFGHTFVIGLAADGVTEQAEGTYGTILAGLDKAIPDVTPTLTPSEAIQVASTSSPDAGSASTNLKLVIWVEKDNSNSAHLAYVVSLTGSDSAPCYVIVDANTGDVLRAWCDQRTQHTPRAIGRQADASTTATDPELAAAQTLPQTLPLASNAAHVRRGLLASKSSIVEIWAIGGNNKTGRIYYNGTNGNPALQVTKNGDICFFISKYVKNGDIKQVLSQEDWAAGAYEHIQSRADSAWLNQNFSAVKELYNEFPAVGYLCPKQGEYLQTTDETKGSYSQYADMQAVMSLIFEMWKSWMGVDVLKLFKAAGVPTPLLVVPHVSPTLGNAFWGTWYFVCGDGNAKFYPLCTAGDVLAHELGHGVTQIINGALLYYGQAGAWNEGFSDMIGMAYTYYATGRVDPLIGAAVMRTLPCLRNLSDPGLYEQSFTATNLTTTDPHVLSGVPNLAYYKLATSPCYDPKVAMLVAQRAAHLYFTPTTSFLEGANAWVRAAKDLGFDSEAVRKAWADVGLWEACGDRGVDVQNGKFFNLAEDPDYKLEDPDTKLNLLFSGAANSSVYVGNITYVDGPGLQPCGVSFALTSHDLVPPILPLPNARPSVYVGINRIPDVHAGIWDCKLDMETSASGPSQPSCDVPLADNTTYHVVSHSNYKWALQGFQWYAWGPKAKAAASAKCFTGGACTSDSACTSGYCFLGYCANKPHRAAAKRS